jgi:DNA-binding NarL/FixJ family response regulator
LACEENSRNHLSVLIVEDDPGARDRLAEAIQVQKDMKLLDAVSNLSDARQAIADSWPDVLLVDLGLPDGDGTELIHEVSASKRPCEIMVITVFGDEKHVLRAIEAGAGGYLLKEEESEQIGRCIRQLIEGGSPISAPIARHLLSLFRKESASRSSFDASDSNDDAPQLTEREIEVLSLIAK